jgi:hypothetical protein
MKRMKRITELIVALAVACTLPGCVLVPLALVGGGVVGGMAISEDTVQNEFEDTYDRVWDASVAALDKAGGIESKDKEAGRIVGYVTKSKVTIRVEQLTNSTVRIQVKVRKSAGVLPDIKTAHSVAHRIGLALKEGPPQETARADE